MPVMEVTISPQGDIRLETRGFTGAACQAATRALEAALSRVQSEERTPEFFQLPLQKTPQVLPTEADR